MKKTPDLITLILCGGIGSRLWPLSRPDLPKQFAPILPGQTLFERTAARNLPVSSQIMIAANQSQSALAFEQMAGLGIQGRFGLIEPIGRNTAPAIALSAMLADPEDILLAVPSDHIISKTEAYHDALRRAVEIAESGQIVTFGIKPEYPETGYGYIEAAPPTAAAPSRAVKSFREKPNAQTAAAYLKAGNYYWNSGMFCFKAGTLLEELRSHAPDVHSACTRAIQAGGKAALHARQQRQPWQPDKALMEAIPSVSIDYAVMEHSSRMAVLPCDIGWSDLGSLDALYDYHRQHHPDQAPANISISQTPPISINAQNNMVISPKRHIALIDVDDLVIVETADSLLISRRGSGQKVKQVVEKL